MEPVLGAAALAGPAGELIARGGLDQIVGGVLYPAEPLSGSAGRHEG